MNIYELKRFYASPEGSSFPNAKGRDTIVDVRLYANSANFRWCASEGDQILNDAMQNGFDGMSFLFPPDIACPFLVHLRLIAARWMSYSIHGKCEHAPAPKRVSCVAHKFTPQNI